jgi:hypothetical protein
VAKGWNPLPELVCKILKTKRNFPGMPAKYYIERVYGQNIIK